MKTAKASKTNDRPTTTTPAPAPVPAPAPAPTQSATSAPSVTIAPRNPAKGVVLYVVTLQRFGREAASYPCRSVERAIELAQQFCTETVKTVARPAAEQAPA